MSPVAQGMKAGVVVQETVIEMVTGSFGTGDRFARPAGDGAGSTVRNSGPGSRPAGRRRRGGGLARQTPARTRRPVSGSPAKWHAVHSAARARLSSRSSPSWRVTWTACSARCRAAPMSTQQAVSAAVTSAAANSAGSASASGRLTVGDEQLEGLLLPGARYRVAVKRDAQAQDQRGPSGSATACSPARRRLAWSASSRSSQLPWSGPVR